jgi:DNA-binding NtrC family response regulator
MKRMALKILMVDDSQDDVDLTKRYVSKITHFKGTLDWISSPSAAAEALLAQQHDVCLLDYNLPGANGLELLRSVVASGCRTPIIILTGAGNHGIDLEATSAGAVDYLVKGQITVDLLDRSIRYAVSRAQQEGERARLAEQLREALAQEVRVLRGLLAICSSCKKIRDESGFWKQLEIYIRDHSEADFTHGICPDCSKRFLESAEADVRARECTHRANA